MILLSQRLIFVLNFFLTVKQFLRLTGHVRGYLIAREPIGSMVKSVTELLMHRSDESDQRGLGELMQYEREGVATSVSLECAAAPRSKGASWRWSTT